MRTASVAVALEHQHREIDQGFARIRAGLPPTGEDLAVVLQATNTLRRHIYLEETFLCPPLYDAGLIEPVLVMLREHAQIWATLDALERDLRATAGRNGANGAIGAAHALSRQLAVRLQHHNLKEEKVLYPAADEVLTPAAAADLHVLLDAGDLPAGWICIKARR